MADLDDFFAKKDRKKSKSTKKFTTTDEVAKKLEDNARKSEKLKKERVSEGEENNATEHQDQDEWKEFEEEKKDYSGLKIGNLAINSTGDGNQGATETNSEQQNEEEGGQENDRKAGPWKRVDVEQQQPQQPPQQEEAPKEEVADMPASTKSAYIAPGLRYQSKPAPIQASRLRGRAAPDIHNTDFFPTLSKSGNQKKKNNEGAFELVQHGKAGSHRHVEQTKNNAQAPKLTLGNRYNTLSDS